MKKLKSQWDYSGKTVFFSVVRGLFPCLCTAGILLAVYAVFGLSPFGEKSLSWCDMDQQTVPLLAEFRRVLIEGEDLFRSPGAGGINFWGIFFFFLASPFSVLCTLVPAESLPWFMNWLVLLKMAACAGTAGLLFRKLGFSSPLWGILYSFSGFCLLYYQNLVWLDMAALFPLLLLSLYQLQEKRRLLPFILAFSAMLVVNYYLSYMVVAFLLLCYSLFLLLVVPPEKRAASAALVCWGALLSVLSTAVVWLPSLLEVLFSARESTSLQNLGSGSLFSPLATTLPTIFTAAIPFAALAFLRRRSISSPNIRFLLVSCLLLCVPLFLQPVNRMWHTGSYQAFPSRYGYILNLLLLLLAAFLIKQEFTPKIVDSGKAPYILAGVAVLVYGFVVVASLSNLRVYFTSYVKTLWGNNTSLTALALVLLAAALVYFLLLFLYQSGQLPRRGISCFLSVMVAVECFFNAGIYIGSVDNSQEEFKQAMSLSDSIEEDGFFRLKTAEKYFDVNLFSAMGFESLSHYTSLTPETTLAAQRRLGYSGYWMEVNSNGGTAFSDAVLANRYCVETDPSDGSLTVSPVSFVLPDTVLTDTSPGFLEELPAGSRMEIQRQLAQALFPQSENPFFLCQPETSLPDSGTIPSGTYHWKVQVNEPVLLYFDCASAPSNRLKESVNRSCRVLVNGQLVETEYPTQKANGILSLGTFSQETVDITVQVTRPVSPESFEVFGLYADKMQALCDNAEGAELKGSGSQFSVSCTLAESKTLFVPLSWDSGWQAFVNGEEVPLYRTAGGYLSLSLPEGENQVELVYCPPGWKIGAILSVLGIGVTVLFLLFWKKRLLRAKRVVKFFYVAYLVCGVLAASILYIFPLALWVSRHLL
ncbi:MAG TPA: YfhO family protein [Candidatus Gallacutalibacter pullistercoris]|nr:YfhO family protein [Candidatus Gallacutalibacter pullistercoris]